jgi:hypothetical protein
MRLAGREAEREGPGLLRWWSVAVFVAGAAVGVVLSPNPVPKTILFDLDLDLVFDLETSLKRPKTERGRSVAGVARSVSLTLSLTVCKAAGVMGREGGFAGVVVVVVVVVVGFSVLVVEVVEVGCKAVLETFLDEGESTEAEAKAGAMTRGEGTEEEP